MKLHIHSQYEDDTLYYNHVTKEDQEHKDYSPHFHDVCELIFFKSGDISYIVDGRKYKLEKNMLVLSRPTDRHCLYIEGDSNYERHNVLFDEKQLPFNIYEKIPHDVNVINFNANKSVINLFDKMDFYCKNLEDNDLKHVLKNLVEEVFYNIIIETKSLIKTDYTQLNPLVHRAVKYIDENLLTLKNIDDICNELFITKSHLHHLFIKHLQISPKKYITTKRLAYARREIYAGGKAIDVCSKCGFSDYSAFFRAYKSHFNHSPSNIEAKEIIRTSNEDFVRTTNEDLIRKYND
ncbi:MAG: AraC family transcriptional regulator [Clostridia bacterium]|nr:AraC family transcriptional regulator [Clostridia bacterium]